MKQLMLKRRPEIMSGSRLANQIHVFQKLLDEICGRDIPPHVFLTIEKEVASLNSLDATDLTEKLSKKQRNIVRLLERELKIVPKGHYQTLWMLLGMSAFGIPLGTAIGAALGNMAFLSIGLPIGMPIGMAIGMSLDKKAAKEGRQLIVSLNA